MRAAEGQFEAARREFADALEAAHRPGASYAFLGRLTGLSCQRVAKILEAGAAIATATAPVLIY